MSVSNTMTGAAGGRSAGQRLSRPLVRYFESQYLAAFDRLAARTRAHEAHDIGCGRGRLALRLASHGLAVRGTDVVPETVSAARRNAIGRAFRVPFRTGSLYDLRWPDDAAELIVCGGVLEHLPDPRGAIDILARLASPWLLASAARHPAWPLVNRLCGGAFAGPGKGEAPIHRWSATAFRNLLETRFDIVELARPLPWSMALCYAKT